MRTNIEIDDQLMAEAMSELGVRTKREAVETALRQSVRARQQLRAIRELRGIGWDGDLDEMRTDKVRPTIG